MICVASGFLYLNAFGSGFLVYLLIPKKYMHFSQGLLQSRVSLGVGYRALEAVPGNPHPVCRRKQRVFWGLAEDKKGLGFRVERF